MGYKNRGYWGKKLVLLPRERRRFWRGACVTRTKWYPPGVRRCEFCFQCGYNPGNETLGRLFFFPLQPVIHRTRRLGQSFFFFFNIYFYCTIFYFPVFSLFFF